MARTPAGWGPTLLFLTAAAACRIPAAVVVGTKAGLLLSMRHAVSRRKPTALQSEQMSGTGKSSSASILYKSLQYGDTLIHSKLTQVTKSVHIIFQRKKLEGVSCTVTVIFASELCFPPLPPPPSPPTHGLNITMLSDVHLIVLFWASLRSGFRVLVLQYCLRNVNLIVFFWMSGADFWSWYNNTVI